MSIRWDGLSAISCRSLLVVTDRLTADSSSPLAVSPSRRLAVYPADHVAPTSGDHRSPRRPLSPRRRVRQLADGPERAGDIRPLYTFGTVRGIVSPDRGTRAGADLRPRFPVHRGGPHLPGPDQVLRSDIPRRAAPLPVHRRDPGHARGNRGLRQRAAAACDGAVPRGAATGIGS